MGSRRKAGGAVAHLLELSRRAVLVGASATPVFAGVEAGPVADPNIAICRRWLALKAERNRLLADWSNHEAWLIKQRGWARLSAGERAALSDGKRLGEIDARLDVLAEEGNILLKSMPLAPGGSVDSVIASLSVARGLLCDEDHPEAHGLITRAARDLTILSAVAITG
ncbi:hypothetical protein [Phenylobacterium sp.]|uniref:hypothetical protein n=1 Tax=Phenylobacterium sp. TaxID=1871053 RepID=UPI002F429CDE